MLYPIGADPVIASLPASSRICASSLLGGYFTYKSGGQRKIWIDGRADYFGIGPYLQYEQISLSKPGWEATLDQVAFTHAVFENRQPAAAALARAGWLQLYRDNRFVVLERPGH